MTEKSVLYRTLKRAIEKGQTDGMGDKLDVFWTADKITKEEYDELMALLKEKEAV